MTDDHSANTSRRGHRSISSLLGVAASLAMVAACERSTPASISEENQALSLSAKKLDPARCDPGQGGFSLDSDNPYFPIHQGALWIYEGDEDGDLVHLEIEVLGLTETVGGVSTRVIEEREMVNGIRREVSRNFFAQAGDGTVCYFGEEVDIYDETGQQVVSHEGQWRANAPGNGPGIIMPASPAPGVKFQMENAPGIAEDEGTVISVGPTTVLGQAVAGAIRIREWNPLDSEKGYKVFAPGFGLVIDGSVVLVAYTP